MTKRKLTKAQRRVLELLEAAGENGAGLDNCTYDYLVSTLYDLTAYFVHRGVARRLETMGYARIIEQDTTWTLAGSVLAYITDAGREALR